VKLRQSVNTRALPGTAQPINGSAEPTRPAQVETTAAARQPRPAHPPNKCDHWIALFSDLMPHTSINAWGCQASLLTITLCFRPVRKYS
jgi:hypothetical protein